MSGIGNKENHKYKTWISSEMANDNLSVKANFENNTGVDVYVSYLLVSRKDGISGSSNTEQSGTVKVNSREISVLSNVKINVNKNDSYKFFLTTKNNNRVIGRDSLTYNGN